MAGGMDPWDRCQLLKPILVGYWPARLETLPSIEMLVVVTMHSTTLEETFKRFWEMEDYNLQQPVLSLEEKKVMVYFQENYSRDETGRFIVPLPIKTDTLPLGESRCLAVKKI